MTPLLYLLFFLSGAAGLMYESVWARYLGLFVGHEAYAQVLVLVIFLGGMSLGATLVARRADRFRDPLRTYALIEGAVGLLGLVFHPVFVASTGWAYSHGFPALAGGAGASLLKWGLAGLLILPQSILLGTTFPLMSAAVLRRSPQEPGRVLGWLYFTNSLGAALGVLVAGFVLVALFGLPGVLRSAGGLNLLVAAAALLVSRGAPRGALHAATAPNAQEPTAAPAPERLERVLLASAFLTAVASFCYEIDWIRMLSLVLGSATHSFELMLSTFILGLALGAFWIRRRIDHLRDPVRTLATIQMLMGLLAVATLPIYLASFSWMEWLHRALNASGAGYALFTVARYAFCLVVMLPATFCAGMTLPLITRMLLVRRRSEAAIGQVYAFNTVGSILGAILAALLLMPSLGLRGLLVLAGLVDIGVGALILGATPQRARARMLLPLAAAGAVLVALTVALDRRLLVSGVYRGRSLREIELLHLDYYADGRTATVAVTRAPGGFLALSTNGKVDASLNPEAQRACQPAAAPRQIADDEVTQLLTGLLPLVFLAGPGDAAVIGFGSGISTHALLASPLLHSVTTVEIEPRMVAGARLFYPANRRAYEDPRSRIVIGDARAFFATAAQRFALIVSEPSNPWVSGVASLFTEEFYRRVRAQLATDGVLVQWLQTYELGEEGVLRVLRAVGAVFPAWQIHQAGENDILIVAAPADTLPTARWAAAAALPALQQDLCGVVPLDSSALEATFLADRALLDPAVLEAGAPNSDYFPVLDLLAERHRFEDRNADGFLLLGDEWFNAARHLMDLRANPVPTNAVVFQGMRRLSARVRQTWQTAGVGRSPSPQAARERYEWRRWQHVLQDPQPPADWRSWLSDFAAVGRVRHAGTAGWIDDRFFEEARRFALARDAPQAVLEVIRFRQAVQGWDAAVALEAAERLAEPPAVEATWLPLRELVDGAVIAAVRLGRQNEARAWLARFRGLRDDPGALTTRILTALVSRQ